MRLLAGITGIMLLLVLAGPTAGASRRRQCVQECGGLVAVCVQNAMDRSFGDLRRGCRAAVLKRCKHEGPAVCRAFCGDGVSGPGEECDGEDLGGRTCASAGFAGGTLACTTRCTLDLEGCTGATFPATGQTTSFTVGDDGSLQRGAGLRYRDNGDGTITDMNTGLIWEKKSGEQGLHYHDDHFVWRPGPGSIFEWVALLNAENGGTGFAGHTDWRLPNLRELQSILNYENSNPSVAAEFNTACTPGCSVTACSCTEPSALWTSTSFTADPTLAWLVDFNSGFVANDTKTVGWHARAVRGPE
jgi:hypothetical protein